MENNPDLANPSENPRGNQHPGKRASAWQYAKGCRCVECRGIHAVKVADQRDRRTRRQAELPREAHGKETTYNNWGCRDDCPGSPETGLTCREVATAAVMARRAAKAGLS
jgi:hypothetical protein